MTYEWNKCLDKEGKTRKGAQLEITAGTKKGLNGVIKNSLNWTQH